jgi:xylulokinase
VLYNTPIWFDTRATLECKWLIENIGEDNIFKISGNPVKPSYTTPKAMWFKNNLPKIYNNTNKFLQSNSYVVYKLTNCFSQDKSQGYAHFFYNMKTASYDQDLCEQMGLNISHYPDIFDCHSVVGAVTKKASLETGLPIGIPVVAGGLDAACGTLGAGVCMKNQTQEQGGQAGGMSICLDEPISNKNLILSNHIVPDLWLLQGGTTGGGGTVKWFSEEFEISMKEIDNQAKKVRAGSEGVIFLPYMAGERSPIWDENAKGVYYGLDFSKTRGHLARATMEGVAYSLRHNLEVAKKAGASVDKLYAMGGSANSEVWMQIKADITGLPILIPNSDNASTLGAVILAGVGTGIYNSFSEAVSKTITIKKEYTPNKDNKEIYDYHYAKYLELYENLKGVMAK